MNVDSTTYIKTAITETTAYKMETSIFEDKVPVVFTQAGNTISSTCGSGIRPLLPSSGPFAWTFCAGAQGGLGSASGSGIGDALGEGCCEVNTGASGGQWTCGPLYAAMNRLQDDYDPYALEEPSDEDPALSSSEDEVDVLLHGTPDQKRKLIRECLTGESESSSEDEFEKEMEAELNSTIKTMEDKLSCPGTGSSSGNGKVGITPTKYYDDIYFDSDSEDEDKAAQVTKKKKKKRHRIPTNDELLYDPEKDNRDQAWVDAQRRGYHGFGLQRPRQQQQPVPNSDAVLNCPACMTTLCLDCQRHESYKTQYRAMFVMNCSVNKDEVLRYKNSENRKKRRGFKKMRSNPEDPAEQADTEVEEIYHPVMCTECSTEVAVYDKDEVFHFFNVLASHS